MILLELEEKAFDCRSGLFDACRSFPSRGAQIGGGPGDRGLSPIRSSSVTSLGCNPAGGRS
jgi:hypothetical protein